MAVNMTVVVARRARLELLQQLSDEGKRTELEATITGYSTKELRTLCGGFGVPAQSKEYAAYQSKSGYSELLVKLLEAKTARAAGLADGAEFVPITGTPSGRTRKTKNCSLRLVNVLFSAAMTQYLPDLVDEVARKKRTEGASQFWEKVRAEFVSTKAEYASIAYTEDQAFIDFNLASPVAHSSEKLQKMWEKLGLAYASVFSQFSVAGSNVADLSACAGRQDVYYLRRWLNDKPELLPIVCKPQDMVVQQGAPLSVLQSVQGLQQVVQQSVQESQQRLQSSVLQNAESHVMTPTTELAASKYIVPSTDDEGERLMKSIKLAYDVLAVLPAADHGSEIEHTVRRRLRRCVKRLKTIEDEKERHSMCL